MRYHFYNYLLYFNHFENTPNLNKNNKMLILCTLMQQQNNGTALVFPISKSDSAVAEVTVGWKI
jgi:hypothetical protein